MVVNPKKIPFGIQSVARRKLRMMNAAVDINDLRVPPGNHLEKLSGNLEGYHSIRINSQWRILFYWENNNACDVEIVDYH
jgi:proteic killer suppression protein